MTAHLWRLTIIALGLALAAASATVWAAPWRQARQTVRIDRSVAAGRPLTGTGVPPGTLRQVRRRQITPPKAPPGLQKMDPRMAARNADYQFAAGQVVMTSLRGIDVFDAHTGTLRWHYHEPAGWAVRGEETVIVRVGRRVVTISGETIPPRDVITPIVDNLTKIPH